MDNKRFFSNFILRKIFFLWFIFSLILLITIFRLNWMYAIPGTAVYIFLLIHFFISNMRKRKEFYKYMNNLSYNMNSATKSTLLNFPMPMAVIKQDGNILWYNNLLTQLFGGDAILTENIDEIVNNIKNTVDEKNTTTFSKDFSFESNHYEILGSYVLDFDRKNENLMMLYFIDKTLLVNTLKLYKDDQTCVAVIIIDNYDELMQNTPDNKRPLMWTQIDSNLVKWTSKTDGILKKFERDKYVFLFSHKYLHSFIENKFEILDNIKEINLGNTIPATLSIGIGVTEESLIKAFKYSQSSLDVALGRGGDQVVLKNNNAIQFFGGKSKEVEKRTKVRSRVIAHAIKELTYESSNVLIMGHTNCDVDALGAAIGVLKIARLCEKDSHIVLNSTNPSIDSFVKKLSTDNTYDGVIIKSGEALDIVNKDTLLIIVDTHRATITECPELLNNTNQIVIIDHHRRSADYISETVLTYQETYASSTCELITEMLQYVDEKLTLTKIEAELLYSGIILDTKNFTFKTGVRTFEAAAFLKSNGVDTISVKKMLQNDLSTFKSINDVVNSAEFDIDKIAVAIVPPDIKNTHMIVAQSADLLLNISGIEASFVLCEQEKGIFISARSLGDINVQIILEKIGGGGHLTMAGGKIPDATIPEAMEQLKDAINKYFSEQNTPSTD